MVADDRGLAHHDAGAVVDEEVFADGGPGVDIDAGDAVGVLGHHSGQHGYPQGVEHMGQPVHRDGKQAGIAEDDLVGRVGGGVTVVKGFHVRLGNGPDTGDGPEEFQGNSLGLGFGLSFLHLPPQNDGDLLVQIIHHILDQHGQVVPGVVDAVALVPGVAGVGDAQELIDDVDDGILVGMDEGVQLVDGPLVPVILQNLIHDSFNLLLNGRHAITPLFS